MSIADRIKQARQQLGLSQNELSKRCGWSSQGRVSHYERGTRMPSRSDLRKVAVALGVSHMWLECGYEQGSTHEGDAAPLFATQYREFPIIKWDDITAWLSHADEKLVQGQHVMALAEYHPYLSTDAYCLVMQGDAMISDNSAERSLYPGDFIVIDPKITPEPGAIVLAKIGDDVKVRKIVYDGNQTLLKAHNPHYPFISLDSLVTILGTIEYVSACLSVNKPSRTGSIRTM